MFRKSISLMFFAFILVSNTLMAVDFDTPVVNANNARDIAVGDLGTFSDDLAYLHSGPSQESYLQFASNNGLTNNFLWPAGDTDIRTGDFDGDGWGDLIALEPATNRVVIRWGTSLFDPDFNSVSEYWSGGVNPVHLEVADLDGDGDDDWAVANAGNQTLGVGISFGRFFFTSTYSNFSSNHFKMADVTGDNAADIIIDTTVHLSQRPDTLRTTVNNGSGIFPTNNGWLQWQTTTLNTITGTTWKTSADMDGDGLHDIIRGAWTGGVHVMQIWSSNGNGTFSISGSTQGNTYFGNTGDVDGDGNADLLALPSVQDEIWLYRGDGAGGFLPRIIIDAPANGNIADVETGDFNNDGIQDLAYTDGDLLILYGL